MSFSGLYLTRVWLGSKFSPQFLPANIWPLAADGKVPGEMHQLRLLEDALARRDQGRPRGGAAERDRRSGNSFAAVYRGRTAAAYRPVRDHEARGHAPFQ